MKLDRLFVPAVMAAALLVPTAARAGDGGGDAATVVAAYTQLRDAGCEVSHLGSPIAVRALRNVPYAQQGKIFKSPELTWLFEHDGGWYRPSDADADVGSAADRECVRKLDAQEKKLRGRVKLKRPIEQALTRHTGAVLEMTRLVQADFKKFTQYERTIGDQRVWSVHFSDSGAALITIECRLPLADAKAKPPAWSKLECNALAAG